MTAKLSNTALIKEALRLGEQALKAKGGEYYTIASQISAEGPAKVRQAIDLAHLYYTQAEDMRRLRADIEHHGHLNIRQRANA